MNRIHLRIGEKDEDEEKIYEQLYYYCLPNPGRKRLLPPAHAGLLIIDEHPSRADGLPSHLNEWAVARIKSCCLKSFSVLIE